MADLPDGVEEVVKNEDDQPVQPEELGDPAKFTWEDEPETEDNES